MKFIGSVTESALKDIEFQLLALYSVAVKYKTDHLIDAFGNVGGLKELAERTVDEDYLAELNSIRLRSDDINV